MEFIHVLGLRQFWLASPLCSRPTTIEQGRLKESLLAVVVGFARRICTGFFQFFFKLGDVSDRRLGHPGGRMQLEASQAPRCLPIDFRRGSYGILSRRLGTGCGVVTQWVKTIDGVENTDAFERIAYALDGKKLSARTSETLRVKYWRRCGSTAPLSSRI